VDKIANGMALGSIEYAVGHLGTQLIVVLGHSKCGAVTATVQGGAVHGHVESIVHAIKPAIDVAKALPGNLTDNTIKANARLVASQIQSSQPILAEMARLDKIAVVSVYYDIENGEVHIL
jgi:carbonic anhydrase